jgi:hypothetical protein
MSTTKMITANELRAGYVVFLGANGSWVRTVAEGLQFAEGPELEAAKAYAQAQHDARVVVEPYVIDIIVKDGVPVPEKLKERIRAKGPTVDYGKDEVARLRRAS